MNTLRPQLHRKGRFLEILVSLLEKTLGDEAHITTPDRLADRDTGEPREVDIAIRTTIGSTSVLIIAECRDRKRPQDSRWIEELATKAVSVGAARVIAVSSSGFTGPAREKARRLGVEVRDIRDLTPATVAEAFRVGGVSMLTPRMTLLAVGVYYTPLIKPDGNVMIGFDEIRGRRLYLPLFARKRDGLKSSLADIVQDGIDAHSRECRKFHEGVPHDGTHIQRSLALMLEDDQIVAIFSDGTSAGLVALSVILEVWHEVVELKPLIAHEYRKEGEALVETVEFGPDPATDGPSVLVTFHRNLSTGRWVIAQHESQRDSGQPKFSFSEVTLSDLTEPWEPWTGSDSATKSP